jgi:hypothetical protein
MPRGREIVVMAIKVYGTESVLGNSGLLAAAIELRLTGTRDAARQLLRQERLLADARLAVSTGESPQIVAARLLTQGIDIA